MTTNESNIEICGVELAGHLDNGIRRWVQNPEKIIGPYVREGMIALDMGCGPGFFTTDMARRVGSTGRVIAVDVQMKMLDKLKTKILGTGLEDRIILHQCDSSKIGVSQQVDFILMFYMVHEVPDRKAFFKEAASILKPSGLIFIAEPPLHVSRKTFNDEIEIAATTGLKVVGKPSVLLSKTALLKKDGAELYV